MLAARRRLFSHLHAVLPRYSAADNAHILWGANVTSDKDAEQLIERLNAKALQTKDASGIEAVQVTLLPPQLPCRSRATGIPL